jgi:hypothetical protein
VTVVFESAIVPKWKDSRISFKNVYISRRPSDISTKKNRDPHAGHKAAVGYDVSAHPAYHGVGEDEHEHEDVAEAEDEDNYAMFDMNVDSIDVTLSLWRWLDGRGLVQDAVIKGVRGVLGKDIFHIGNVVTDRMPKTALTSSGTPTNPGIQLNSGVPLAKATSTSSLYRLRICLSPSTSPAISGRSRCPSSVQT